MRPTRSISIAIRTLTTQQHINNSTRQGRAQKVFNKLEGRQCRDQK